jgi:hypothetical protein
MGRGVSGKTASKVGVVERSNTPRTDAPRDALAPGAAGLLQAQVRKPVRPTARPYRAPASRGASRRILAPTRGSRGGGGGEGPCVGGQLGSCAAPAAGRNSDGGQAEVANLGGCCGGAWVGVVSRVMEG